jgi:flavin-dependent dehydrogenase
MVTTDDGFASISACVERSTIEKLRRNAGAKDVGPLFEEHLLSNIEQLNVVLDGSRRVGKWLTAGVVVPEGHTRSRDGILAVGNAAGESHPIVAEGISMAIQGAGVLHSVLEGIDPKSIDEALLDHLADEYDRRWRSIFARRIRFASAAASAAMSHRSRPLLAAILTKFPRLLTAGTRMSGKVWPMR